MRCSIKEKLVVAFAAVVLLMMVVVLLPYRSTLSNEYRVNVGRAETERSGSYRISSVRDDNDKSEVTNLDTKTPKSQPLQCNARPISLRGLFDTVKTYVIFLGHSRSGHSIVGSLLDAHPEMIVTHEHGTKWSLFEEGAEKEPGWDAKKLSFYYKILEVSRAQATFGLRADKPPREDRNHSYNYHVRGQWQGQFRDQITVIGDKMGHFTAEYFRNPEHMDKLEHIQRNLGVSLKLIHVLRNPFDVLGTRVLRAADARDSAAEDNKAADEKGRMDSFIKGYFGRTEAIARVRKAYDVLDIPGDELVQAPQATMREICRYVGITCEQDYIDACADLLYGEPSITRHLVEWDEEDKRRIQREIDRFPFLQQYSFDSNP